MIKNNDDDDGRGSGDVMLIPYHYIRVFISKK